MKDCCLTCENLEYRKDCVYPYRCLKHKAGRFSRLRLEQMVLECWKTGGCNDYKDYKEMEER